MDASTRATHLSDPVEGRAESPLQLLASVRRQLVDDHGSVSATQPRIRACYCLSDETALCCFKIDARFYAAAGAEVTAIRKVAVETRPRYCLLPLEADLLAQ